MIAHHSLTSELAAVRTTLADSLPWSPHDYIPEISRRGDRLLYAEELTRPLSEAEDLRLRVNDQQSGPLAIFAERLPWDSQFFGYGVARLNGIFPLEPPLHRPEMDLQPAVEALLEEARRREIRYLFANIDPRDLALLRAVGNLGFALIETKYFHHGPLLAPDLSERFPVRKAVLDDIPSLMRTASHTVNQFDRFHADPAIHAADAARLMETWVEQSVLGRFADVTIVPDMPEPTAFVTYRYHQEKWTRWGVNLVQGVLSAVAPDSRGWMGKLAPEINHHLRTIGATYSFGSTQVTNRPIIWFAEEGGGRFGKCEHVFRRLL